MTDPATRHTDPNSTCARDGMRRHDPLLEHVSGARAAIRRGDYGSLLRHLSGILLAIAQEAPPATR